MRILTDGEANRGVGRSAGHTPPLRGGGPRVGVIGPGA
jgi:hypothetical protein